jgi:hypothetical protein
MELKENIHCERCGGAVGGVLALDRVGPDLIIFMLVSERDATMVQESWEAILDLRLAIMRKTAERMRERHLAREA